MIAEMDSCKWDPDTGTLTTVQEANEKKNLAELEEAAWYKDAYEDIGAAKWSKSNPPPSHCLIWMKTSQSRPFTIGMKFILP